MLKKLFKKEEILQNPVVIYENSGRCLYDIFLVGDYVGQADLHLNDFLFYHYSNAVEIWPEHSLKIFQAVIKTNNAKWDFDFLVKSDDWRIRALVAANGKHLTKLITDNERLVTQTVLVRMSLEWPPHIIDCAIAGLSRRLNYLKKNFPDKHSYSDFCSCCNKTYKE